MARRPGAGAILGARAVIATTVLAVWMVVLSPVADASTAAPGSSTPASVSAQVAHARARLATTLALPHPGRPEALTHPGADHAGSGMPASLATAPSDPSSADPSAAAAHAAVVPATSSSLPGLDVSSYQGDVDWAQVAADGADFAYTKATQSTSYTNPYFAQQYDGAAANGLIRGAYAFAIPSDSSGAAQADYFVSNGGGWSADNQTLPGMVDLENNPYPATGTGECYGLTQTQMVAWVASFVNEYHADTGRWAVIYTNTPWWDACTGSDGGFAGQDPLWVANYSAASSPPLPPGWDTYTIWQDADSGTFPGDQDVFNGTAADLLTLANDGPFVERAQPGAYHPLSPTRITDTRPGSGFANSGNPIGPTGALTVNLQADVPSTATAVALSVTALDGTTSGFLSVYPAGVIPVGPSAVINYVPGSATCTAPDCVVPNLVVSGVNGGQVTVVNGSTAGSVDVVVDLEGYFDSTGATTSAAGHYYPSAGGPRRVADTRCAATPQPVFCAAEDLPGPSSPTLQSGQTLDVPVTGKLATGQGVEAAVVQIAATDTTANGYLTAYAGGSTLPLAANVNFVAGQTTSTRAIVPVGPNGDIEIYNYSGMTDVVVDVVGFFSDSSGTLGSATGGSLYTPIIPARLTDTRTDGGALGPGISAPLGVAGLAGIPAQVNGTPTAAVLNVTEASATGSGYLTVTPTILTAPATTADVNFTAGEIQGNADVVKLGTPNGTVSIYNPYGTTNLVVDAFGYFSAA